MSPPSSSIRLLYRGDRGAWSYAHGMQLYAARRWDLSDRVRFNPHIECNLSGPSERSVEARTSDQLTREGVPNNDGGYRQRSRSVNVGCTTYASLFYRPFSFFTLGARVATGFRASHEETQYSLRNFPNEAFRGGFNYFRDTSPDFSGFLRLVLRTDFIPYPSSMPDFKLTAEALYERNSAEVHAVNGPTHNDIYFRFAAEGTLPLVEGAKIFGQFRGIWRPFSADFGGETGLDWVLGLQMTL